LLPNVGYLVYYTLISFLYYILVSASFF